MNLTVGKLENELRKYPKGIEISVECGYCNHGSTGSESILKVNDKTNQTYGYIELVVNNKSESRVELATDEKEFYEKEVNKLKEELRIANLKIKEYEEYLNLLSDAVLREIKFINKFVK